MQPTLTNTARAIGLGMCIATGGALAQTYAVGPYYATPSWDQKFPASTRFIVLTNWDNAAVLDRETGLVWERSPSTTTFTYTGAQRHCMDLRVGGRTGWRVPAIQEAPSLLDPSVTASPALPAGHPFANVGPYPYYWTATRSENNPEGAWAAHLNLAIGNEFGFRNGQSVYVWCVRGGAGLPAQ